MWGDSAKEVIAISIKNNQLLSYIESIPPGTKISVRELALAQNVSEGTAYKAVKDAEQRGLVVVRPKFGTVRVDNEGAPFNSKITALTLARLLGLSISAGKANLSTEVKRLVVCDGTAEELHRQLRGIPPQNCLCLCGSRPEIHSAVVGLGANLLLTGGAKASWLLMQQAEGAGLYVLSASQSSYALLRIFDAEFGGDNDLTGGVTVSGWMQTPDYLYYNDIVADWQKLYFNSSMVKQYPLVDDDLNIYGALDLWKAPAAVPSSKLRSLVGDRDEILRVAADAPIREVAKKFIVEGIEFAVVLDREQMVGIISAVDLLRYYMHTEPNSYEYAGRFLPP